jgi:hypothetical protein
MMVDISVANHPTFTEIPFEEFGNKSLVSKLAFKVEFITKHIQGTSCHKSCIIPSLHSRNKHNRLPNRNCRVFMLVLCIKVDETLLIPPQQGEFLVVFIVREL